MSSAAQPGERPATPESPDPPRQQTVSLDDSGIEEVYANFCHVTGSPEELLVDFALNPQAGDQVTRPIKIRQRVVMNYFTAKRLMLTLHAAVQRHETVFGELELDVEKRAKPPA